MKKRRSVYIVIAIIVIIILVGLAVYSFTGRYTTEIKRACHDSDDGINYEVKGATVGTDGYYVDNCPESMRLKEFYCDKNNRIRSEERVCDNLCIDGACVE